MWLIRYLRSTAPNFHVVVPGVLYRSATPSPENLEKWQRKYKIATWLDLRKAEDFDGDRRTPSDKTRFFERQMQVARHLGIERVWLPISDRKPTSDESVRAIMQVLEAATTERPVLVACQGGRHRTGLAIALYRMRVQGWFGGQAFDEAKKRGFYDHGHEEFGKRFRQLLGLLLVLLMAVPAFGQHPFIKPQMTAVVKESLTTEPTIKAPPIDYGASHRFDRSFWLASSLFAAASTADIVTTHKALERGAVELNPFFADQNGAGLRTSANAIATTGIWAIAAYCEKRGHRRFGRILLLTGAAIRTAAAFWNHNRRR